MTKEEIKNYVENDIDYNCQEYDLEREDVIGVVMYNIIYRYHEDQITVDDTIECANYLGFEIDKDKLINSK